MDEAEGMPLHTQIRKKINSLRSRRRAAMDGWLFVGGGSGSGSGRSSSRVRMMLVEVVVVVMGDGDGDELCG